MTLDLVDILTSLDKDEDIHLARILVLLKAFNRPEGPAIEGITKLAKLDFLLRYPSCLEKALLARGVSPKSIPVDDYERLAIEARMIRYRYGPWDHRYRRFLNILAARRLVTVRTDGRTIQIDLTVTGDKLAESLSNREGFKRVFERALLLKKHLDLKARRLMEFIYELFPELTTLEFNEGITFIGKTK
ncbi:hypothetical protein [Taklimakanibacter albus]|uniref:Uncharacterized protein n=1 Tax=Taklimakanibacter albus TaxID=2800327 RepID=A0ACC5R4N5_9HYPH|nr:hypothetical protein [Aestuariivirga sp. YIM B02566]MBK1867568.1 hypothetical protein [Aestuariivirga sp. YIM B02566]